MEQQDNTKLQEFHQSLVKDNYAVPDLATFENTLRDPAKSKEFYDALVKDNYSLPDYDTFTSTLGLKKKDISEYGLPSKEVLSEMFGNISKVDNSEVSERPLDEVDPEKFKTPDLTLKTPELKGPKLGDLSNTVISYLSGQRITDREYKGEVEKHISELDKKISELPKDDTEMLPAINYSGGLILPSRPVSEEKAKLLKEKDDLKLAITKPDKLTYILGKAYNQSLIGLADGIVNGEKRASEDWLKKYDAGTLTDATATALGFLLDMPFFGGMGTVGGKVGELAAKPIVDRVMANSVKKYVAAGIEENLAKKLALKSATKVAQSIAGMTSSGVALGSYGAVGSALGDWAKEDANFDDIKWGNALKRGVKDFALGVGVGGLGLASAALSAKANAIPNLAGRIGAKAGVATGGLTAESALFSYGSALLDGRSPNSVTGKDFLNTVAMLGMLKASNVAGKVAEAVANPKEAITNIYKSLQYDPQKPGQGQFAVDIQPWEAEMAGGRNFESLMNMASKDDNVLASIMGNENIPALLKQKILWGARGTAMPDVNITADKIALNNEYVDLFNKDGVLVDKWKFSSPEEATQVAIEKGLQLEDNKMQMNSALPDVDKVKIVSELKNEGADIPVLVNALDKPVADRTTEESKLVGDYAKKIPKPKKEKKVAEKAPEVVQETNLVPKKKRSTAFKPGSRTFTAVEKTPNDFEEAVLQYFVGGGKVKTQDLIDQTGYPRGSSDLNALFGLHSKEGTPLDVFHESLENSFGRGKGDEGMDMINEIMDVIQRYPSRGKMLTELERRQQGDESLLPSDEEIKAEEAHLLEETNRKALADIYDEKDALDKGLLTKQEYDEINDYYKQQEQHANDAEKSISADEISNGDGSEKKSSEVEKVEESPLAKRMREEEEKANTKIDYKGFMEDITKSIEEPTTKEEKASLMDKIESTVEKAGWRFEVDYDEDPDFSSVNIFYKGDPATVEEMPPMMRKIFDTYTTLLHESHENAIDEVKNPVKQKQIEAISNDYKEQIAEKKSSIKENKKAKDKAIAEAQDRQGLFGDTKDKGEAKMFSQDEQGFGLTPERLKAIEQPFREKEAELNKQIASLNKERDSKIGEITKQKEIKFDEKAQKTVNPFKKSKINDIVYHGNQLREQPSNLRIGWDVQTTGRENLGIFFGTKEQADEISKAGQGIGAEQDYIPSVTAYHIDLRNPLRLTKDAKYWFSPERVLNALDSAIDTKELRKLVEEHEKKEIIYKKKPEGAIQEFEVEGDEVAQIIRPYLEKKGYDGVIYKNEVDAPNFPSDSYIVFNSKQIKRIDEKAQEPKPDNTVNADKGNDIPTGTEGNKEPVATKGEEKPVSTPSKELNDAVSKYGWSAVKNPDGYWLQNKDGKPVVKVTTKGDRYQFFDMTDKKLMDGRGQIGKSAEKLLKEHYYAKEKPVSTEVKPEDKPFVDFLNKTKRKLKTLPDDDFHQNKGLNDIIYDLAGDANKKFRQKLMSYLTGENIPLAKSGVNAIGVEVRKWIAKQQSESKVEIPVKETPKSELYTQAEKIIAETSKGKLIPELYDLINKSNDYEGLKSLLEVPYVKTHAEAMREVNSRLRTLERHPELVDSKSDSTPDGIKFKDKTYQSVDEVLDALDKGDITFEESKPLREQVGKFEEGLRADAKKVSESIGDRIDTGAKDMEKQVQADIADENSKLSVKFFPDLISRGNTALYKQLVNVRDSVANAIAGQLKKGVTSQADAIRWSTKALTNLYNGLLRTQADVHGTKGMVGKLEMTGTVKSYAPHKAHDLLKAWRGVVNSDPDALTRVWSVLDPEQATKAGEKELKYGDLNSAEKNLYFTLKEWGTWVWSTNYANGLIPTASHLKFKGDFDATGYSDYIARMYDKYEEGTILSPEIQEFISRGNSAVTSRLNTDYMKLREETDDWKKEHAIKDPAYLTAKRVMQTIQNVAVKQYMDLIIDQHPEYVRDVKKGEDIPKGFTKLGASYSWGPLRNKAVANHIVEDFTGFFYKNGLANTLYDGIKMWDRMKLNQFYKKYRTVYNPFVQTGNVTGNVFFASINGINPFSFVKGMVDAATLHKKNPALYDNLLKSGLIGDVGITGEMKPLDLLKEKKTLPGKADEWATKAYSGADNLAKISAYQIFRKQGMSHEASVRRAYDAFQNYATVGKTWDVTSKIPLVGPTFVKFQADLQRILLNNLVTTPLTTIGTIMAIKMMGNLASALSGETEEEQKIREGRKGVARIPFIDIPMSFKVGKAEVNVARYLTPLYIYPQGDNDMDIGELSKFLPLQVQKKEDDSLFPLPAFADATWGWVGSVLADRDFRMMSIQNPYSSKYTDPNITTDERIFNVLNFAARSQIPFYKGAQDIFKAATGQLDYYGRKRTWEQSILNNVIKIQQFDKPEMKDYVEHNLGYLTSRYAALASKMGDAQGDMFKAIKRAEDKGLDKEVIDGIYKDEAKVRDKRLQKSLDEQIPIMEEIERETDVYKKWYPKDKFVEENYQNIEAGKNQRFNVLDGIDMQKKYPEEYLLLKKNDLLKKPDIPKFYRGTALTDAEKKDYSNIYWSEYVRQLDMKIGLTQEEMDEMKSRISHREKADTPEGIKAVSRLNDIASTASTRAKELADRSFRASK